VLLSVTIKITSGPTTLPESLPLFHNTRLESFDRNALAACGGRIQQD